MSVVTQEQTPQLISDLVNRIVAVAHLLRIILFGSAARGDLGPDSDLDVMVVMPDGTHRAKTLGISPSTVWLWISSRYCGGDPQHPRTAQRQYRLDLSNSTG